MLIASLDLELRLYSEQRSAEAAPKKLAQAEQQRLSSSCWLLSAQRGSQKLKKAVTQSDTPLTLPLHQRICVENR